MKFLTNFFDEFFDEIFDEIFDELFIIASFRIGVPSILFPAKKPSYS